MNIHIALQYRNASFETDGDITTVRGELVNVDELISKIVPALVEDSEFQDLLLTVISARLLEHMTPEEVMSVFERFVPPADIG